VKRALIVLSLAALTFAGCAGDGETRPKQPERASDINLELGISYLREGKLVEAKEKIDRALEQNPRNAQAHAYAGLLYMRLGDEAKGDSHFERALSLDPKNPEIQNNYAVLLCQRKRFDRGEKLAVEAAGNPLYKTPHVGYMNAGNCARGAGNLKGAENHFRQVLTSQPRFPPALYEMADLEFSQSNYMAARAFFERYQAAVRSLDPATLWLGVRIERALGNTAGARSYGRRLQTEFPTAAETKQFIESERNTG
jgi:type IV pilus assembly protein PilF